MKFSASRMSDGNKLFPAEIHTEENGLNVKIPGLFGGKSTFLSYPNIASVSVDTPLVGFSTIHFNAMGTEVKVHGFTKDEVRQIKAAIDEGKSKNPVSTQGSFSGSSQQKVTNFFDHLKHNYDSVNESIARDNELKKEEKLRIEGKVEEIAQITISGSVDDISQQLNQLFALASSKPDKKVKNTIIEKIEFGIMKLRSANAITEVDFFEKKLEPLKKKGLFGF